jgi:ribosomal protein L22
MAEKDEKQTEEETPEAEATEAAEEKPKPKRRARAKKPAAAKAEKAEKPAKAEKPKEAKEKADEEEAEAEAAEAEGQPEPEDESAKPKPAARRRRGAEVSAGRKEQPKRKPRGEIPADVTVRARARYVRTAPRKARLVIDHIRGKDVDQARAILTHTPRAASRDVLKLLDSAIANAENNHDLVADELKIGRAYVDEGPTLKRYRPRALGRATRIRKRTSHMTIELVSKE